MEETEFLTDESLHTLDAAQEESAASQHDDAFEADAAEGDAFDADTTADAAAVNAATIDEATLVAESQPFFGRWYRLVSATNWEKGNIIQQWRDMLIASGAPSSVYSDEAWARRVGGVTSSHAGRLRRVFGRFGSQHESYPGLYWSHFLAALDWDDAEMWLEGAVRSGWTVDQMRQTRWEANGAVAKEKPKPGEVQVSELEEDIIEPAQGGEGRTRSEDDDGGRISSGPLAEDPDFGEASNNADLPDRAAANAEKNEPKQSLTRPFEGLPDFPPDLGEAMELFKLAIIRHKAAGWKEVLMEDVVRGLEGLRLLAQQPAE